MQLPQTEREFLHVLADAAELGAKKALQEAGVIKPFLKLCEAEELYGQANVHRWEKEGLIRFIKDGPRNAGVRIDRIQIDAVAKTCNRATYLSKEERK